MGGAFGCGGRQNRCGAQGGFGQPIAVKMQVRESFHLHGFGQTNAQKRSDFGKRQRHDAELGLDENAGRTFGFLRADLLGFLGGRKQSEIHFGVAQIGTQGQRGGKNFGKGGVTDLEAE